MNVRKSRPFQAVLLDRLANPEVAKHYLNEALDESPESFLSALKTVAQAHQIAKVAKDAGVQRETLYRSLSNQGNPTLVTLSAILKAVGLRISIGVEGPEEATYPNLTPTRNLPAMPNGERDANSARDYPNTTQVSPGFSDAYPLVFGEGNSWTGNGAYQNAACVNR